MINFKQLTNSEIPIVVQHMVDFYDIDGYPIDTLKSTDLFHEFISKPHLGKCFTINYNNEICGYVLMIQFFSFEMGGYVLLLDELYVSNEFQGKGIGKAAMQFVKDFAASNDYKKIVLEVEPHNERAIHLYEKENFRKHKRSLMLFP